MLRRSVVLVLLCACETVGTHAGPDPQVDAGLQADASELADAGVLGDGGVPTACTPATFRVTKDGTVSESTSWYYVGKGAAGEPITVTVCGCTGPACAQLAQPPPCPAGATCEVVGDYLTQDLSEWCDTFHAQTRADGTFRAYCGGTGRTVYNDGGVTETGYHRVTATVH